MQLSLTARKAMASGLAASTILWASVGMIPNFAAAATHTDGCLVLSGGIVWMITGGTRRGFTSAEVFQSYGYNFSQVVQATAEDVALPVGPIMTYADSTLVKGPNDPLVYLVSGGQKRGFTTGSVFTGLGYSFANIQSAPANTFADLPVGANLDSASMAHPNGSLVISNGAIWQMSATGRMGFPSMAAFNSFGYKLSHVANANAADLALPNQGDVMQRPGCSTTGTTPVPVSGSMSVSLASSNPVASSIIADTTSGDGAQALIPMLSVNFAAGSSAATVTTVQVTRGGISANSDVSNIYLYDGNTRLAEYTSYASGVATFSNTSGLFTVPANSARVITVKMDLANGTGSGKTISFALTSVSLTGGSSVSGLPITGNQMTTATVADLGKLTVNAYTTYPANVDPGQTGLEVWRFNLVSSDQDIVVSKLNLTMVGTIATTDVQNIKLMVGGVQVGTTQQIAADNTVLFDLSGSPFTITSGQTKTFTVNADIIGGTGRTFKFTIRKSSDIAAMDKNYGVVLKPNQTDTLAVIEPTSGSGTTINNGKLSVTRNSSSPSSTIPKSATNVTLGTFDLKATGEAIKVSTIIVNTVMSVDQKNMNNGKLYVDGSQIGSTTDLDSDATDTGAFVDNAVDAVDAGTDDSTTFNLGNTLIIPAGVTKTLTVAADTYDGNGTALTGSPTVTVSIGGIVATGQVSLATISVGTASANQLTMTSGALTTSKNLAMADATASAPTGVQGTTNVRIGSFIAQAGTGEGVSVTQIVLKDTVTDTGSAGTSTLADAFQNLKVMYGSTQVGSTVATLTDTAATTYTFSVSPAITIAAGAQAVFDIYADIFTTVAANPLSDINADSDGIISLNSMAATGLVTSSTADDTNVRALQNAYIANSGTFSVSTDSGSPAAVLIAGSGTEMTVAQFTLKETTGSEGIRLSQVVVTDTSSASTSFSNVKLFIDGAQVGTTQNFGAATNGTATFSGLSYVVPANGNKTLVIKATPNTYPNGTAASTHNFTLAASAITASGQVSNTATNGPTVAQTSNTHMWARTSLAASSATQGVLTGRVRTASDKIETITLTSGTTYPAALRGATQINDDDATGWAAAGGSAAVTASATQFVSGTKSIRFVSQSATAGTAFYDMGATGLLNGYSKVSFWTYGHDAAAAAPVFTFAVGSGTSPADATWSTTTVNQSTSITTTDAVWTYQEISLSGLVAGSRYLGIRAAAGTGVVTIYIDNIRFYNDSIKVTLTGNLKASLAGNTKPVYLKDASGTIKMVGFATTTVQDTATATLTVGDVNTGAAYATAGDLNISSTGTPLDLVLSSIDHVLADAGATAESFVATINLGTATSAGDFRWYDGGVTATSPLTFVNGATPLQSSIAYQ